MATTKKTQPIPVNHRVWKELHPTEHGGFAQGDVVKVTGTTKSRWTFWYANLDRDGNLDSYTVFGGNSHGQSETKEFRSFAPERVLPIDAPRRRKTDS